MKRYRVDVFDSASIQAVINELSSYRLVMETKFNRAISGLVNEAVQRAQTIFGESVTVGEEQVPSGENAIVYTIYAEGRAVGFLEFGAGDLVAMDHPFKGEAPFRVYPGSYSDQNAQQYSRWGFWIFGGKTYSYVRPRRGLYEADKLIRDKIREYIKAEFT